MPSLPDAVPVLNTSATVCPAFGLMARLSVSANGILSIGQPTIDGQQCIVNGPCAIPPSSYGSAPANGAGTYNPRVLLAYDGQDGTPAVGETWGAAAGSWLARKNKQGFVINGGAGYGVVNADRWQDFTSSWKNTVRVATTTNGTLTTAFFAGQVVDGVTLVTGDLILLKNQTSGAENGIYVVPATTGLTPFRALGANGGALLVGAVVTVSEGIVNKDTIWQCTTDAPITLGSTALVWTRAVPNSWKTSVRCATTANGTLSSAYANSSTVDGVTLATGDRVLLKDQTSGSENGIYVVQASGSPVRASDAWSGAELVGASAWVSEGTTNADTIWACTTNAPITINSTSLAWVRVYPTTGFFARLTTSSGGKWKWFALTLDGSGAEADDGSESAAYNATPLTIDGTNFASVPILGMRVWMRPSKTPTSGGLPQYEFLPLPLPTTTKGDLVVMNGSLVNVRLPVGANTYVLTADSAQPEGVKWAPGGGGGAATGTFNDATGWKAASTGWTAPSSPTISVSLPAAGTYLITATCGMQATSTTTGSGRSDTTGFRLYDVTASAVLPYTFPTDTFSHATVASGTNTEYNTVTNTVIYTVTGPSTIRVEMYWAHGGGDGTDTGCGAWINTAYMAFAKVA